MTEQQPIIFLDDISVTFKTRTGSIFHPNKVHAVQNVTLKLMPGETIGIVGESGCGKSTTANVMCGLQSPTSGHVFFKGQDVTKRTPDLRKQIGRVVSVVFQDPATALNPRMIVHDQLLDPLLVHKVGTWMRPYTSPAPTSRVNSGGSSVERLRMRSITS